MDDKHSHIDDWLRKTAAQQPAPENSDRELKRQAWSKMAALLDEDDAGKPQPRVVRFRTRWAAILISFIATSAVFAATLWLAPRFFRRTQLNQQVTASTLTSKEYADRQNKRQLTISDTPLLNINTTSPSTPADPIKGFAGTTADPDAPVTGATNAAPDNSNTSSGVINDPATGNNSNKGRNGNKNQGDINSATTGNVGAVTDHNRSSTPPYDANSRQPGTISPAEPGKAGGDISSAGSFKGKSTVANKRNAPHNKVNNTAITRTANENEALATEQTVTDKRSSAVLKKNAPFTAADAGLTLMHPVRSRNVFALQLPSLSAASREQRVPELLFVSGREMTTRGAGRYWAVQGGLLSPLSSALGVRAGLLYHYPLRGGLFLQPQLSASYITGYNRQFTHVSFSKQRRDTSGGAQDNFDVDTTTTPYTLKRAFAGSVGINIGYRKNKMAVSAGLAYSMAMPSGTQDTAIRHTGVVRDTTGTSYTGAAFSTGKLPGNQQLNFNVDLSWYVLPRLQAGVNYSVALWRSKAAKEFQAPLQKLQDNSILELYIRIPICR